MQHSQIIDPMLALCWPAVYDAGAPTYQQWVSVSCFWIATFSAILAGALVQWLNLPSWKVGDRGFAPHSDLQVSKKRNVSSPLTRKNSILWGTPVTERWRAQPQTAGLEFRILCQTVSCRTDVRARDVRGSPRRREFDTSTCAIGPGGQCDLILLTILKRFSWPSLVYMCTKVA